MGRLTSAERDLDWQLRCAANLAAIGNDLGMVAWGPLALCCLALPALAHAKVTLPPANGQFDYQLGGPYPPAASPPECAHAPTG